MNQPITNSRTFTFPQTGESITLEESNTERAYLRRLRIGEYNTGWRANPGQLVILASQVDPHVKYCHTLEGQSDGLPYDTVFLVWSF